MKAETIGRRLSCAAAVTSIITLLSTATAGGPSFDPSTAKGGLPRCKADLFHAGEHVKRYKAELGRCRRGLAVAKSAVARARRRIAACEEKLAACTAETDSALVAQTGQQTCYATTIGPFGPVWEEVDCDADAIPEGQDGQLQAGAAPPDPRFTDGGDGTVLDEFTGLVWLKDWGCASMDWTDALAFAGGLEHGQCGLSDGSGAGVWRLPNRNELLSVVNISELSPAVSRDGEDNPVFDNVGGTYWSSSSYVNFGGKNAWVINFNDGTVNILGKGVNASAVAVRDITP
jgi:hypothetical protein